jgi:RHS repeat-associated protein
VTYAVADFPAEEFRLDGDPAAVRSCAAQWSAFGTEASDAAGQIRSLDTTLFIGPEGEEYRQGLKDSLPPHLDITGHAYQTVAGALTAYAEALSGLQDRMRPLAAKAPGLWQALQAAEGRVTTANDADRRHEQSVLAAALAGPKNHPAPADPYQSDTPAADAGLSQARQAWNDNLTAARNVKTDLRTAIDTCCTAIHQAADTRFKHNPHGLGALTAGFKNFVKDHVADLAKLSGALKLVSGIAGVLSFVPVIGEVAAPIALITAGAALLIDSSIKLATGKGSWTSIAVDGALLAVPFGLGKGAKALGGMRGVDEAAPTALADAERGLARGEGAARGAAGETAETATPLDARRCMSDPVDVATGQMVLGQVDLDLPGALPLRLTRAHISSYRVGRWFGPSWASTLDQRLEIDDQGVCYTSPDGMVLTYPPAGPRPVLPAAGPRLPLEVTETGYTITDHRSGQRLHFGPVAGRRPGVLPLVAVTDRNGSRIDFDYHPAGTPAQVRHSGGYRIGIDTAGGRITALRLLNADPDNPAPDDTDSAEAGILLIRYGYDPAGRLTEVTNSSGHPLRFGYDRAGRMVTWTDRNGTSYRYDYDQDGRCVHTEGTGGVLTADLGYQANPRVTTVTDSLGHRTTFRMDEVGRVIAETDPLGNTTTSEWDSHDRLAARTDPLGRTTRWAHDTDDNLTAVTRPDGTQLTATYNHLRLPETTTGPDGATWQRTYDERGNLRTVTDPLGAITTFAHDDRGHLIAVTDPLGNTRRIDNDVTGLPVAVTDPLGATTRYQRDAFGRVTAVVDPLGNTTRYAYSVEGNLTARTLPDGATEHGATERWAYQQGRVTLRQQRRPSAKPHTWRYTWNTEDQLTAATTPDGQHWRYRYDPFGRRIAKQRLDSDSVRVMEQVDFTWDGPILAEQTHHNQRSRQHPSAASNTTVWDWKPGQFRPVSQTERVPLAEAPQTWIDQQFHAIITDLVGTPTELVTTTGHVAWHSHTPLWGTQTTTPTSTIDCPLRFPGQYHDPETQLNYNLHRHYDPTTARYHTPDPLGLTGSPNPHTYVPNPTTWTDPLGLTPCNEVFYRGMSNGEYGALQSSGRLVPRGESFVTQDLSYVQQLAARHPDLYETIAQFDMQPGTRDALIAGGARSPGPGLVDAGLGHLPLIGKGMNGIVHVKSELGAINFGLRSGSAEIFNSRIIRFGPLG